MKKRFAFIFVLILAFFCCPSSLGVVYAQETVYLGGMPVGFVVNTVGVEVVGVNDVISNEGLVSPAKLSGIEVGDYILKIDNNYISSVADIEKSINNNENCIVLIKRGDKEFIKSIIPAKDINGKYRLGVFVKDNISGIGTVTYIKENRFASLGHPIVDKEGRIIDISGGFAYSCNINGCVKGERGEPGELKGVFLRNEPIFKVEKNLCSGVFGCVENYDYNKLTQVEVAKAVIGDAVIVCTLNDNECAKFDISIVKVDDANKTKNFVIKVDDACLIEKTGGIVQGMSGSPILQNGKLVGAVTHVFLNDPTRGFGIDIYNMLNN